MSQRHEDQGEEEEEDLPQQVVDLAEASVPNAVRGIRACKRCGILKTMEQFANDGCENCPFLDMVSDRTFRIDPLVLADYVCGFLTIQHCVC